MISSEQNNTIYRVKQALSTSSAGATTAKTAWRITNESEGRCLQDMPSHRIHPTDHAASSKHIQYKIRAYLYTADVQVI